MQHDLVIFEPPHGHFQFKYPWELYKDLSRLCRHCMYTVTAMDGCLRSEFQCPVHIRELLALPMIRLAQEASKVCHITPKIVKDIRVIPYLNGTFCEEFFFYNFPLVVLQFPSLMVHARRERLNLNGKQPILVQTYVSTS